MTVAEKLAQIAANEQRVYDAGYAKGKAEGGTDSMIGTWVIHEEPSVVGEPMFDVNVVGKGHYYDGENFIEHDLRSIGLTWSQFDLDGFVWFRGVDEAVTGYYTYGEWQSDGYAFNIGGGTDTTLLRTITLTEEPTDENLRAWLKANADYTLLPSTDYEDGYADGRKAEYDAFWDAFQNGGAPKDYSATFGAAWTEETFRPKYDLVPTNAYMMFRQNQLNIDLVEYLERLGIALDTSQCTGHQYMFSSSKFTRVGVVDLSASGADLPGDSLFVNCRNLVTVDKIILKTGARGEFSAGCFNTCSSLENLKLEGALTGTIDLNWSTKLSKDSIENVHMAADRGHQISPNTPVMILSKSAVNKAFETSEGAYDGVDSDDWNNLVNNSSWTITLI